MKRLIYIFTIAIATLSLDANAQSVTSLRINPDARSGGMGEAGTALSANQFSLYNNFAAAALSESKLNAGYSLTMRTSEVLKNNNLHTIAGYYQINEKHTIGLGVRYFSTPSITSVDGSGNEIGEFKPNDIALDLGYAYAVSENWGLGVNARYVRSAIASDAKANAFAFDLGVYFNQDKWSAGLSVSNVGTKADYGSGSKYDMPAWVKLGVAREFEINPKNQITCAVEGSYIFLPSNHTSLAAGIGAEYAYNKMLFVRGGYFIGEKDVRNSYGTVGLGVQLCGFQIDASYIIAKSDVPVNNTIRLSLGYKF